MRIAKGVLGLAVLAAVSACASDGGPTIGPQAAATQVASAASLEGRSFHVKLTPEGQSPMSDRLVFAGGLFESEVCTRAAFNKAAYTATPTDGGIAFTVECDSPSRGHNVWHGTVAGDHIEGTCVRTPLDGTAGIHLTFTGAAAK